MYMKNLLKLILGLVVLSGAFTACKKDENKVTYDGGTAPALAANKTAIPLTFITKDNEAVTFSWNNPNYKFNTGLSSQNVTYVIEIDTAGANFTNPKRKQVSVANDLSKTITQNEFNDYLLNQLEIAAGMPHNIEVRLSASIAGNIATRLYSNILSYTVTPYAIPPKVTPPSSGELYMVGNATPGGWNNPVPVPSQKFTKISPTQFEITIAIVAGNSYLFLPVNGSWDAKYGFDGSNNNNDPMGDNLKFGGGDVKAPADGGNYKVEVNFQTGKFKLTKL